MKKIIFINIPMKDIKKDEPLCYAGRGNAGCTYEGKVLYAVNAYLAEEIDKDDEVKVVMLRTLAKTEAKNETSNANIQVFKDEFEAVCKTDCEPVYKIIETPFTETKASMETRYRALLAELEDDCQIYADADFGPRLNLIIMMNVMQFAKKFFNAKIKALLYTKVEFDEATNKIIPDTHELFDITSFLHFLNLTNSMEAETSSEALEALDAFFKL